MDKERIVKNKMAKTQEKKNYVKLFLRIVQIKELFE